MLLEVPEDEVATNGMAGMVLQHGKTQVMATQVRKARPIRQHQEG